MYVILWNNSAVIFKESSAIWRDFPFVLVSNLALWAAIPIFYFILKTTIFVFWSLNIYCVLLLGFEDPGTWGIEHPTPPFLKITLPRFTRMPHGTWPSLRATIVLQRLRFVFRGADFGWWDNHGWPKPNCPQPWNFISSQHDLRWETVRERFLIAGMVPESPDRLLFARELCDILALLLIITYWHEHFVDALFSLKTEQARDKTSWL